MSDKTSHLGEQFRTGIKGIHGAGEAIRGTMMQAVDEVFNTKEGIAKDRAIVERGQQDMHRADEMIGHEHGIQHNTTATESTPTTGPGSHFGKSGNVGSVGATTTTEQHNR